MKPDLKSRTRYSVCVSFRSE